MLKKFLTYFAVASVAFAQIIPPLSLAQEVTTQETSPVRIYYRCTRPTDGSTPFCSVVRASSQSSAPTGEMYNTQPACRAACTPQAQPPTPTQPTLTQPTETIAQLQERMLRELIRIVFGGARFITARRYESPTRPVVTRPDTTQQTRPTVREEAIDARSAASAGVTVLSIFFRSLNSGLTVLQTGSEELASHIGDYLGSLPVRAINANTTALSLVPLFFGKLLTLEPYNLSAPPAPSRPTRPLPKDFKGMPPPPPLFKFDLPTSWPENQKDMRGMVEEHERLAAELNALIEASNKPVDSLRQLLGQLGAGLRTAERASADNNAARELQHLEAADKAIEGLIALARMLSFNGRDFGPRLRELLAALANLRDLIAFKILVVKDVLAGHTVVEVGGAELVIPPPDGISRPQDLVVFENIVLQKKNDQIKKREQEARKEVEKDRAKIEREIYDFLSRFLGGSQRVTPDILQREVQKEIDKRVNEDLTLRRLRQFAMVERDFLLKTKEDVVSPDCTKFSEETFKRDIKNALARVIGDELKLAEEKIAEDLDNSASSPELRRLRTDQIERLRNSYNESNVRAPKEGDLYRPKPGRLMLRDITIQRGEKQVSDPSAPFSSLPFEIGSVISQRVIFYQLIGMYILEDAVEDYRANCNLSLQDIVQTVRSKFETYVGYNTQILVGGKEGVHDMLDEIIAAQEAKRNFKFDELVEEVDRKVVKKLQNLGNDLAAIHKALAATFADLDKLLQALQQFFTTLEIYFNVDLDEITRTVVTGGKDKVDTPRTLLDEILGQPPMDAVKKIGEDFLACTIAADKAFAESKNVIKTYFHNIFDRLLEPGRFERLIAEFVRGSLKSDLLGELSNKYLDPSNPKNRGKEFDMTDAAIVEAAEKLREIDNIKVSLKISDYDKVKRAMRRGGDVNAVAKSISEAAYDGIEDTATAVRAAHYAGILSAIFLNMGQLIEVEWCKDDRGLADFFRIMLERVREGLQYGEIVTDAAIGVRGVASLFGAAPSVEDIMETFIENSPLFSPFLNKLLKLFESADQLLSALRGLAQHKEEIEYAKGAVKDIKNAQQDVVDLYKKISEILSIENEIRALEEEKEELSGAAAIAVEKRIKQLEEQLEKEKSALGAGGALGDALKEIVKASAGAFAEYAESQAERSKSARKSEYEAQAGAQGQVNVEDRFEQGIRGREREARQRIEAEQQRIEAEQRRREEERRRQEEEREEERRRHQPVD